MVRAITNLKAGRKTTFLCLSNANIIFIMTVFKVCAADLEIKSCIHNPLLSPKVS
jgi:pyridoxal phosphate phosphatase PHOSPHO2